jgi:hypothetical protein
MDSSRALLATGRLPIKRFLLAKEALCMIQDNKVTQELGIQALRVAVADGMCLYDALKAIEPKKPTVEIESPESPTTPEKQAVPAKSAARSNSPSLWQKVKGLLPRS